MALSLPQANMVGTLLESMIFGAYLIIFLEHMRILHAKKLGGWSYIYLLGTSVVLFSLITMHLVLDFKRTMQAFVGNMSAPNAPLTYFQHFDTLISRFRTGIYSAMTIVSDLFIIYRCFIVWGNSYVVTAIPFLLFLADIVTAGWSVNAINEAKPSDPFALTTVNLRARYFYSVTLSLNLLCTILIALKIWMIQRRVNGISSLVAPRLMRGVSIILESAAIYSPFLVALIVTSVVGSAGQFVVLAMLPPTIGTVFSYVIVRVGSGVSHGDTQITGPITFRYPTGTDASAISNTRHSGDGIEIRLERIQHIEGGEEARSHYKSDFLDSTEVQSTK